MSEKCTLINQRLFWAAVKYLHALKPQPQSLYLGKCIFPRLSRQQTMVLHHSLLDELLFMLLERQCCALLRSAHNPHWCLCLLNSKRHNKPSKSLQLPHPFPGNLGSRGNAPHYFVIEKQYHNGELLPIRVSEPATVPCKSVSQVSLPVLL